MSEKIAEDRVLIEGERNVTSEQEKEKLCKESSFVQGYEKVSNGEEWMVPVGNGKAIGIVLSVLLAAACHWSS